MIAISVAWHGVSWKSLGAPPWNPAVILGDVDSTRAGQEWSEISFHFPLAFIFHGRP